MGLNCTSISFNILITSFWPKSICYLANEIYLSMRIQDIYLFFSPFLKLRSQSFLYYISFSVLLHNLVGNEVWLELGSEYGISYFVFISVIICHPLFFHIKNSNGALFLLPSSSTPKGKKRFWSFHETEIKSIHYADLWHDYNKNVVIWILLQWIIVW